MVKTREASTRRHLRVTSRPSSYLNRLPGVVYTTIQRYVPPVCVEGVSCDVGKGGEGLGGDAQEHALQAAIRKQLTVVMFSLSPPTNTPTKCASCAKACEGGEATVQQ